ncbi:MAG: DUF2027 domain-containing protein [Prolixibacteraceae bacterium]|nr:DUF2027 domain-containing protein [Prolixibacteraceae bacterium]
MLQIGDKVKFLNQVGGGRIVGIQSKNLVVVENEDGFEIPTLISELVKVAEDTSYDRRERIANRHTERIIPVPEPEPEPEHIPEIIEGNDLPRFFVSFHPKDQKNPVGGEIEVHLINDSNFTLLYHYAHFDGENYQTIDSGLLESNTKQYLEGLTAVELNQLPRFCFRIMPFRKESKKLAEMVEKEITVNSVKFFKEKSFTDNDFFDDDAMIFELVKHPLNAEIDKLTEQDFKSIVNEKDRENRPVSPQKVVVKTPDVLEVDLHIEELIDSTAGLSNREILEIQMDKFHSELKLAIEKGIKRVVFIHGVGNGVLKQEIARKLQSTYARYSYQDASFQEYGFGATMVILRRK